MWNLGSCLELTMGALAKGWGEERPSRGWERAAEELTELSSRLLLMK